MVDADAPPPETTTDEDSDDDSTTEPFSQPDPVLPDPDTDVDTVIPSPSEASTNRPGFGSYVEELETPDVANTVVEEEETPKDQEKEETEEDKEMEKTEQLEEDETKQEDKDPLWKRQLDTNIESHYTIPVIMDQLEAPVRTRSQLRKPTTDEQINMVIMKNRMITEEQLTELLLLEETLSKRDNRATIS